MVTYSDLFEFVIMLIAFATFIYKLAKITANLGIGDYLR